MAARNDITGDSIQSKVLSEAGRNNWENIFGNKKNKTTEQTTESNSFGIQERDGTGHDSDAGESGCPLLVREDKDCVHCSCKST